MMRHGNHGSALKLCLEMEHVSRQTSRRIMSEFQDRKSAAAAFTHSDQMDCAGPSKATEQRFG